MVRYLRAELVQGEQETKEGTPIRFTASSPGVKRDGKSLEMGGWNLGNYRKNPVFLWAHSYGMFGNVLPIGRADVTAEPERLVADVTFDQEDPFARQVESKYRRGFLHAVSVGWDENEVDGTMQYELLDISAVPVPGDPDALMERQIAGLRRMFEEWGPGEGEGAPTPALPRFAGEGVCSACGRAILEPGDAEGTVGREGLGPSTDLSSRAAGGVDPVLVELVAILAG